MFSLSIIQFLYLGYFMLNMGRIYLTLLFDDLDNQILKRILLFTLGYVVRHVIILISLLTTINDIELLLLFCDKGRILIANLGWNLALRLLFSLLAFF